MQDIAGWIALAATCVAALMTASNLGARMTGWGFVVFTFGASAWAFVGFATHQTQLLWSNVFLGVVDIFGIWRWLGRRARFGDASRAEEIRSEDRAGENLFSAAGLDGMPVLGRDGSEIGHVTDALVTCSHGDIAHLVIREGGMAGVGETLRRLPWKDARVSAKCVETDLDLKHLARLPIAESVSAGSDHSA